MTRPQEVTRPVLARHQRYLFPYRRQNGEALSGRSQHMRLVPVRVWFRWLEVKLGHAQLTSTQVYTQVAIRALTEIHTARHPGRLERREEAERIEQARPNRLLKQVYGQKDA